MGASQFPVCRRCLVWHGHLARGRRAAPPDMGGTPMPLQSHGRDARATCRKTEMRPIVADLSAQRLSVGAVLIRTPMFNCMDPKACAEAGIGFCWPLSMADNPWLDPSFAVRWSQL